MPEDFLQKITEKNQVKFNINNPGLYAISITARCDRKDDLRVEINNQFFRETPPEKNIQKFNIPPAWNGTKLKGRSQTNIFLLHLETGEHTITFIPKGSVKVESLDFQQVLDPAKIEFNLEQQAEDGDKRPWFTFMLVDLPLESTLHNVTLDLGDYSPVRIPTVSDPKWTGDFADDTDQIILARALFGEARNTLVPDKARIAIGWVIKNRVASSGWPDTYWQVITKPSHFSAFNLGDDNRPFVEDPFHTGKEIDRQAWRKAYEIAGKVISGELVDPTQGANHYYDDSISTPSWAEDQQPTLIVSYTNQYRRGAKVFFLKL